MSLNVKTTSHDEPAEAANVHDADTILVMDHGAIVEQGSHQELMARQGFYYDLYQSQFAAPIEAEPEAAGAA